jgi:hypothetical protein
MTDIPELAGLVAVVQYRPKKDGYYYWNAMAAFDNLSIAETYADDCAKSNSVFEYRVIEVKRGEP